MFQVYTTGSPKYGNDSTGNKHGKDVTTYEEALELAKKAIAHGATEAKIVKVVAIVERKIDVTITTAE